MTKLNKYFVPAKDKLEYQMKLSMKYKDCFEIIRKYCHSRIQYTNVKNNSKCVSFSK